MPFKSPFILITALTAALQSGPCVHLGPNFFGFLTPSERMLLQPGATHSRLRCPAWCSATARSARAPADCRTAEPGDPALGVIDAGEETYYFGASLGGIMGLMFAALSPDVSQVAVDVPATNFAVLLQRSRIFQAFQLFLDFVQGDPLTQLTGLQMLSELWVRGESAGYANHVTGAPLLPLRDTNPKNVLMGVALYDTIVSPLAAQIAAATMQVPNGAGSVLSNLPGVDDVPGALASAHVVYDTASFVAGLHDAWLPPLANLPAARGDDDCEPHGRKSFIPAALLQLAGFLQPGGVVEGFCTDDGLCNASEPIEIPLGASTRCEPAP